MGVREITLTSTAVLLCILGIFFPLRYFPKQLMLRHLLFHTSFAFVIIMEIVILEKYKLFNDHVFKLNKLNPALLQIFFCIFVLDLLSYFWHRFNHTFAFLWRWHKFHHQTEAMDPFAAYRFHPIEVFFGYQLRSGVIWLLGFDRPEISTFILTYGLLNLFQHSNLRLPQTIENILGIIFVTPSLHHTHHLKDYTSQNSNFATIFIFWDRVFRSYKAPGTIGDYDIGLEHSY